MSRPAARPRTRSSEVQRSWSRRKRTTSPTMATRPRRGCAPG
jgi:hypothetical protein